MASDKFPITVLDSMETHIAHLRMAFKEYSISELLEIYELWKAATIPPEYREIIKAEIDLRDGSIKAKKI